MTKPEELDYHIDGRQLIAETDNLRVQILTLEAGEEIPFHYHTEVSDTFICIEGELTVSTQSPNSTQHLKVSESLKIPPKVIHKVLGRKGNYCKFVIVQGVGKHDYFPVDGE